MTTCGETTSQLAAGLLLFWIDRIRESRRKILILLLDFINKIQKGTQT